VTDQWPTAFGHYEEINVKATLLLLEVVKILGIKKLIYVSTANCFGYGSKKSPATELSEFRFFNYNSGYIMSKFIAQQHVLKEIEKSQLPVVIVNPAFMIGPYDSKPSSGKIIMMGLNKKILFCPPGGKSFVDVRDAAVAVCNAITLGKHGECYLLANHNLSYWEFFETLSITREQAQTKIKLPKLLILTIGIAGSVYEKLTRKPAPLNFTNARLLCLPLHYNGDKARRELQMPQTSIHQTLADALHWFERNKMIGEKSY
jgi:dihydroflavonol-4-reductase